MGKKLFTNKSAWPKIIVALVHFADSAIMGSSGMKRSSSRTSVRSLLSCKVYLPPLPPLFSFGMGYSCFIFLPLEEICVFLSFLWSFLTWFCSSCHTCPLGAYLVLWFCEVLWDIVFIPFSEHSMYDVTAVEIPAWSVLTHLESTINSSWKIKIYTSSCSNHHKAWNIMNSEFLKITYSFCPCSFNYTKHLNY